MFGLSTYPPWHTSGQPNGDVLANLLYFFLVFPPGKNSLSLSDDILQWSTDWLAIPHPLSNQVWFRRNINLCQNTSLYLSLKSPIFTYNVYALVLFLFARSESRVLKEEMMNLNQRVEGLRQYLLEEAKKNQFLTGWENKSWGTWWSTS